MSLGGISPQINKYKQVSSDHYHMPLAWGRSPGLIFGSGGRSPGLMSEEGVLGPQV